MVKHLLTKTLLLVAVLCTGATAAWADTVTFTAGTDTGSSSVTKGDITVSMSTMSRDDNYRCYANSAMTVKTSSGNITSIVITCTGSGTSDYSPGKFTAETGTYTYSSYTGTWVGNAESVKLNASAQVRMTEIVVTYTPAGTEPDEPEVPVSPDGNVFYETFAESTGTMGWSGNAAAGTAKFDNTGWNTENANGADGAIKCGTGSKLGKATTPEITLENGYVYTLTFRSGAWSGDATTLKLSATNATLSANTVTLKDSEWSNYEITLTGNGSASKITFQGNGSSKSRFFLDDVRVVKKSTNATVTAAGWATFVPKYNVKADNVNAYVVTSADEAVAKLHKVTEIPADTPVLLETAGTYTLDVIESAAAVGDNCLKVSDGTISADDHVYVLGQKNGNTGFYLWTGEALAKGKVYMQTNTSGARQMLQLVKPGQEETGIATVENASAEREGIYNLQGVRVAEPGKGLYVVGGKKVMFNK